MLRDPAVPRGRSAANDQIKAQIVVEFPQERSSSDNIGKARAEVKAYFGPRDRCEERYKDKFMMPPPRLFHPPLVASGATLLIAALVTDILYCQTFLTQWENFSVWLITGGLFLASLAGVAFLLDVALRHAGRVHWLHSASLTVATLLSVLNAFIHSRDGYTAVVPQGLALSAIVTVLLLTAGWRGWSLCAIRLPSGGPRQ